MGWSDCGTDSQGRPIGYSHDATCDAEGCSTEIHRGLAYACGGHHGAGEWFCEGYFCEAHRGRCLPIDDRTTAVCEGCYTAAKKWAIENPDDSAELREFLIDWEGEQWAEEQDVRTLRD